MFNRIIFSIILVFLALNTTFADQALVDIDFKMTNISIPEDRPSLSGKMSRFPYKKITEYADQLRSKIKLGRRLTVKYHIINYQPKDELFSDLGDGYELFKIIWLRDLLHYRFKKKDGKFTSGLHAPIGFVNTYASPATVRGYGDIPVSISPALSIDIKRKFNLFDIEAILKNKNYKVITVKIPIERCLYLKLDDKKLKDKKLEFSGSARLGDSAIITERNSFWYPFDKYSLNFTYISFYPSRVTLNFQDIEDLDLSASKKIEFTAKPNQKEKINLLLLRKDRLEKHIWPSLTLLITFLIFLLQWVFQGNWFIWQIRVVIYVFTFLTIYFTFPNPMHVPKVNILSICLWTILFGLIICVELYLKKKSLNKVHGSSEQELGTGYEITTA